MSGADRLRKLDADATPGPWGWFGRLKDGMYLATTHSGRRFVMDFVRQGMRGAQPRFQLDGLMVKAEELAVRERPYREEVADIDHPDARLLVEMRNALPGLLDAAEVLDRIGQRDPADADGLCFFCGSVLVGTDHDEGCLWRRARAALACLDGAGVAS